MNGGHCNVSIVCNLTLSQTLVQGYVTEMDAVRWSRAVGIVCARRDGADQAVTSSWKPSAMTVKIMTTVRERKNYSYGEYELCFRFTHKHMSSFKGDGIYVHDCKTKSVEG